MKINCISLNKKCSIKLAQHSSWCGRPSLGRTATRMCKRKAKKKASLCFFRRAGLPLHLECPLLASITDLRHRDGLAQVTTVNSRPSIGYFTSPVQIFCSVPHLTLCSHCQPVYKFLHIFIPCIKSVSLVSTGWHSF